MFSSRASGVVLLALIALAAGCQPEARTVLPDLPMGSILDSRPTASTGVRSYTGSGAGPVESAWLPQTLERPWRWIVIHHSATENGCADSFDKMHRGKGWDELGYHFVICNGNGGPDGQVQVGSRWLKQKWGAHAGGTPDNAYNNYGIGICLVGEFTSRPPTEAQLSSLRRLVSFLAERYNVDPACVIGHRDAPGTKTECPGNAMEKHLVEVLRLAATRYRLARN